MDEQPAAPAPDKPLAPLVKRCADAQQHMQPIQRLMPMLHMALDEQDVDRLTILWPHLMQCLGALRPFIVKIIGSDGGIIVESSDEVTSRQQIRLIRCDTCRGLVDLTIAGTTVNTWRCRCKPQTEDDILRELRG